MSVQKDNGNLSNKYDAKNHLSHEEKIIERSEPYKKSIDPVRLEIWVEEKNLKTKKIENLKKKEPDRC